MVIAIVARFCPVMCVTGQNNTQGSGLRVQPTGTVYCEEIPSLLRPRPLTAVAWKMYATAGVSSVIVHVRKIGPAKQNFPVDAPPLRYAVIR